MRHRPDHRRPIHEPSTQHGPIEALSNRERDVLSLIAQGRSNAGIAKELFISERTVESHGTQIFTKLGIAASIDDHRRVLAVLLLLRSTD